QCLGITTKGVRCKLRVDDGYCRYHQSQKGPVPTARPSTPAVPAAPSKPGYIYMYTFARLYNGDKLWLKAKNLPGTKKKDQWLPFNAKHSEYTLIKIGMTTQTVEKRFKQWQDKCHHEIVDMLPASAPMASHSKMSRLVSKFSRLSIKPERLAHAYRTFRPDEKGFYCRNNLAVVESEIHRQLRNIYGYGDILCQGCNEASSGYKMHIEWFLIPKTHIPGVYRAIDSICLQ
ncbi:DUF1766-domain-containing protein, partial [Suhomyces tanzawaensis NRRL Y-17324]